MSNIGVSSCICSLLMFVSDASGDHMVETYSSMGLVMALCVLSIVSIYFLRVVDVSICIVLHACDVVLSGLFIIFSVSCVFSWVQLGFCLDSELDCLFMSMYVFLVGIIECLFLLCLCS